MTEAEVAGAYGTDVIIEKVDTVGKAVEALRVETIKRFESVEAQVDHLRDKQIAADAVAEERSKVAAVVSHRTDRIVSWLPNSLVGLMIIASPFLATYLHHR